MGICIKTQKLLPAQSSLRPVQRESLEFLELVESIRYNLDTTGNGLINSICVREHPTREGFYEVIDGMWRFEAYKYLDIPEIDAILKVGVTNEQILGLQIQANSISYETRPIEFAKQMQTLITLRDSVGAPIDLIELGQFVGHSSNWVKKRLSLLELSESIQDKLREGILTLGKAVALARLVPLHQEKFLKEYGDLNNRDFEIAVGRFINRKHFNGTKRAYKLSPLRPKLQSMDSLVIELDTMATASDLITRHNAQTAIEGAKLILEWVLNLHDTGREERVKRARNTLTEKLEIIRRQQYEELNNLEYEKRNF